MQNVDLILYLISIFFGGAGAWVVAKWGKKLSLLDKPGSRSSHDTVTPKGGGIGILAAFVFVSLILNIQKSFWVPAALLSLFSFYGDRFDISPKLRLLVQFAAALILLLSPNLSPLSPQSSVLSPNLFPPSLQSFLYLIFLSVFMVGTANFYNFMDGIDGIAGIVGVVGFGFLSFFAYSSGLSMSLVVLGACVSISCIGFLLFNVPKARVFMGDIGSVFLGFVFAGLVFLLSKTLLDMLCLTSFLFVFYADELITMAVRIKDGENILQAHRRHFYQLLANEYQISHWKISSAYGLFQVVVGMSVLLVKQYGPLMVMLLLSFYFALFSGTSLYIRSRLMNREDMKSVSQNSKGSIRV